MTPRDDARRARHRIPAQRQAGVEPELPPHDSDLDSYLAALAPEAVAGPATGRFGSSQVFSLRLPALRMEQLRRLAAERGRHLAQQARVGRQDEAPDQGDDGHRQHR